VACPLAFNTEVATGLAPFRTVGLDATASNPELREKMSQFMAQRAIDLVSTKSLECGVKQN
jgi:hypothetical protein